MAKCTGDPIFMQTSVTIVAQIEPQNTSQHITTGNYY